MWVRFEMWLFVQMWTFHLIRSKRHVLKLTPPPPILGGLGLKHDFLYISGYFMQFLEKISGCLNPTYNFGYHRVWFCVLIWIFYTLLRKKIVWYLTSFPPFQQYPCCMNISHMAFLCISRHFIYLVAKDFFKIDLHPRKLVVPYMTYLCISGYFMEFLAIFLGTCMQTFYVLSIK